LSHEAVQIDVGSLRSASDNKGGKSSFRHIEIIHLLNPFLEIYTYSKNSDQVNDNYYCICCIRTTAPSAISTDLQRIKQRGVGIVTSTITSFSRTIMIVEELIGQIWRKGNKTF